jgi:hypothetical protein
MIMNEPIIEGRAIKKSDPQRRVVTVNRLVWRKLYGLAETRFRLES